MNAEQVVDKILSEANAEAEKIVSEAKNKADTQKARLEAGLADYAKKTQVLAKEAAEDRRSQMLAKARMENKKDFLAVKVALLNEVFQQSKKHINTLAEDDYRNLMSKLMTDAIETGNEEVIIGTNETRIDNSFIKHINRSLGPGFKGNLQLASDKADIDGGFILRRDKVQINVSTDVLIAQARERLEMELANELFGENTLTDTE